MVNDFIYKNFQNIQDLLRYAETKNSGLFVAAMGIAVFKYTRIGFNNIEEIFSFIGYVFIITTIVLCLISFFAKTKLPQNFDGKNNKFNESVINKYQKSNHFLFSDIAEYEYEDFGYLKHIINEHYLITNKINNIDEDILIQILSCSKILKKKFDLFNYALLFFILGIFFILISIVF